MQWDFAHQLMEIFNVHVAHVIAQNKSMLDRFKRLPGKLPLIKRLDRGAACSMTTASAHTALTTKLLEQIHHLNGRERCVDAFIARLGAGALDCLLDRID